MLPLALLLVHCLLASSKRQQIGVYPIKGNLWRAKFPHEIATNFSSDFKDFVSECKATVSEDTGIRYYYSATGKEYKHLETDDSICFYSLERHLPDPQFIPANHFLANTSGEGEEKEVEYWDTVPGKWKKYNFTLYFGCDATCCALECCQRDVPITILGSFLIALSLLIFLFYASVYIGGCVCAWRNGALGRRGIVSARSPSKNGSTAQSKKQSSVVVTINGDSKSKFSTTGVTSVDGNANPEGEKMLDY